MEELWNDKRTHPYAYYITDGYVNLTCLQFYAGLMRKPDVGIEHFGFYVDDLQETVKKIAAFDSSIKLEDSPEDGRYEDKRFHDPEGNRLEIASNTWGTEGVKNIPRIRHIAIHAKDLECLCDFYKSVFGMKEITRKITRDTESTVVYLSDNDFSLTLIECACCEVRDSAFWYSGAQHRSNRGATYNVASLSLSRRAADRSYSKGEARPLRNLLSAGP